MQNKTREITSIPCRAETRKLMKNVSVSREICDKVYQTTQEGGNQKKKFGLK